MADTYKILGQVAANGETEQVLYVSPENTSTILNNIIVTNTGAVDATFTVAVHPEVKQQSDLGLIEGTEMVIFGAQLETLVSTDGLTWTTGVESSVYNPNGDEWDNYGNWNPLHVRALDEYWLINKDASTYQVAHSTNAITWTVENMAGDGLNRNWANAWIYGGGKFWEVIWGNQVYSSVDGITYNLESKFADTGGQGGGTVFNGPNDTVVFITGLGISVTDNGGLTWTDYTMPFESRIIDARYINNTYVVNVQNDSMYMSTDLITWTIKGVYNPDEGFNNMASYYRWVDYAFGKWILYPYDYYSSKVFSSTDLVTYQVSDLPQYAGQTYGDIYPPVQANGKLFAADDNNLLVSYTTNGVIWQSIDLPANNWEWWPMVGFEGSAIYQSPTTKVLFKNATIKAGRTEILEPGIVLGEQNTILVGASVPEITFSTYGVEIS